MTWEEIEKAITESNLQDQAAIWASGTEKGKELTENYAKVKIDSRTREIYDSFDNDLRELGIEKNGRKTYQAIKDEVTSLRDKIGEVETLQNKIKELESKGADEALTAQLNALTTERDEFQNTIDTLKREAVDSKKKALFDAALSGLNFKEELPSDLMQLKKEKVLSELLSNSEFDGEQLRIKRDNGEIWLNNEHKPIDAQNAIKELFSPYLKASEPAGLGANPDNGAQGASALTVGLDVAGLKGKGLVTATEALTQAYLDAGRGSEINTTAFTQDFINLKQKIEL